MVLSGTKMYLNLMKTSINHNENRDKGYILESDVEYPKDLPFLPKRMKIKNPISLFVVNGKKKTKKTC